MFHQRCDVLYFSMTRVFIVQVLGMKLLVNWLLGLSSANDKQCKAVLNVLDTTMANEGDLQGQNNIS